MSLRNKYLFLCIGINNYAYEKNENITGKWRDTIADRKSVV